MNDPDPRARAVAPASGAAEAPYADMLSELEAIVIELESDAVDVDVLAARVERAAELVEACRARIERARLAVEKVLGEKPPGDPDLA